VQGFWQDLEVSMAEDTSPLNEYTSAGFSRGTFPLFRNFLCLLLAFIGVLDCSSRALARSADEMMVPSGNYTRQLGNGSLEDPSGVAHTQREAAGRVIVAIFSIPNMSQGGYQEKWATLLAEQSNTKLPRSVFLVLFENMAQAGMFKGIARSDMKDQFRKGSRPLVVLDETGSIFKKYGVPPDKTEILVYNKTGKLVDVEQDLGNADVTLRRLHAFTKELQEN
jgi:hypothetical protein